MAAIAWAAARRGSRALLVGAAWAVAALAPVCLITADVSGRPVAHHRLYFACAGAVAILAGLFVSRRRAAAAALLIVLVWSARLGPMHFAWTSPDRLWRAYTAAQPASPIGHIELATLYADAGKLDAAAGALRRATRVASCSYALWQQHGRTILNNLGLVHYRQGDAKEALTLYLQAEGMRSTAPTLNNIGVAHEALGEHDDAMDAYREALKLAPKNADALYNLGNCHARRSETDQAMKCYQAATQHAPKMGRAQIALGQLYDQAKQPDRARDCFRAAAQDDTLAEAHYHLGLIAFYQDQPDFDEALELADKGETYALLTNVFLISGAAITVTGALLLLTAGGDDEPRQASTTPTAAPWFGPSSGGVTLDWTF